MKAWLFDVDGVLTMPEEKKANPEIIKKVSKILDSKDIIGLNTGRSLVFVKEEVLKPLEKEINDKNLLKNIFSVCEKGGVWAKYENGRLKESIDESLKPPNGLEAKTKKFIEEKLSETTFFDDTKKTMISAEYKKGSPFDKFPDDQKKYVDKAKELIDNLNIDNLNIEPTVIATDIQNKKAGKDLGIKRFLDLIKNLHEPNEFETFGDSPGDFEMHLFLKRNGHKSKFIYVGKKELETKEDYIKTSQKYDKGTLEYLKNI